jgi:hypothetical protein
MSGGGAGAPLECKICFTSKADDLMADVPCAHSKQFCMACVAKITNRKCPYKCPDTWPVHVQQEAAMATALHQLDAVSMAACKISNELQDRKWWSFETNSPCPAAHFVSDVELRANGEWELRECGCCGDPTRFISLANALQKARQQMRVLQQSVDALHAKQVRAATMDAVGLDDESGSDDDAGDDGSYHSLSTEGSDGDGFAAAVFGDGFPPYDPAAYV